MKDCKKHCLVSLAKCPTIKIDSGTLNKFQSKTRFVFFFPFFFFLISKPLAKFCTSPLKLEYIGNSKHCFTYIHTKNKFFFVIPGP